MISTSRLKMSFVGVRLSPDELLTLLLRVDPTLRPRLNHRLSPATLEGPLTEAQQYVVYSELLLRAHHPLLGLELSNYHGEYYWGLTIPNERPYWIVAEQIRQILDLATAHGLNDERVRFYS